MFRLREYMKNASIRLRLLWWSNLPRPWVNHYRSNRGWLLYFVTCMLFLLEMFSPVSILSFLSCLMDSTHLCTFSRFFIDTYVMAWLVGEMVMLLLMNPSQQPNYFIIFFMSWSLVDILQSQYRLSFLGNEPQVMPARSLMLVMFNYAEVMMIYAIIYIVCQTHYDLSFKIPESLEYSFKVFMPFIGMDNLNSHIACVGKMMLYSEVLSSLFIHILIIQRVLAFFSRWIWLLSALLLASYLLS